MLYAFSFFLTYLQLRYIKFSILIHSEKCWVVLTQVWVKYGQTQPLGSIFLNCIYYPTFGFVHI